MKIDITISIPDTEGDLEKANKVVSEANLQFERAGYKVGCIRWSSDEFRARLQKVMDDFCQSV